MNYFQTFAAVFFIYVGAIVFVPTSLAQDLRIAVAANFYPTLKAITDQFIQQYPVKIDLLRGSTGKLYAQIIHAAPYDIFFAADTARPMKLEKLGRIIPGTRFTYAIGQLVFCGHHNNQPQPQKIIPQKKYHKIAIANPKTAPYGLAAKQVLQRLAVYKSVKQHLVYGENVNQTLHFLLSGGVDYAFIAKAQYLAQFGNTPGKCSEIDPQLYQPVRQQAVILKQSQKPELAKQFIEFMQSDKIQNLIQQHGYRLAN